MPDYARADIAVKAVAGVSIDEMTGRVVAALLAARPDVLAEEAA